MIMIYIYIYIMMINEYILHRYILNPWKIFCDLRFLEVYKTTFIKQLRRWN